MSRFAGKRVLILEDEPLVAMLLEEMLLHLGCEVVGPAGRIKEALDLARADRIDAAVLDVNIHGERSDPVAAVLEEQGLPYVFATGYGAAGVDGTLRTARVLQKPYRLADIADALSRLFPA